MILTRDGAHGGEQLGLPGVLLPSGGAGDREDRAQGGEEATQREAPPGVEAVDRAEVAHRPEDQPEGGVGSDRGGQACAVGLGGEQVAHALGARGYGVVAVH